MMIIFLDIDGVINLESGWCTESIKILNKLTQLTQAKLVITSDWKYAYTLSELKFIFKSINLDAEIIDTTENISNGNLSEREKERSQNILNYIKAHNIKEFLIIDDLDLDSHGIPKKRFLRTKFSIGLKEKDLFERCLSILKNK